MYPTMPRSSSFFILSAICLWHTTTGRDLWFWTQEEKYFCRKLSDNILVSYLCIKSPLFGWKWDNTVKLHFAWKLHNFVTLNCTQTIQHTTSILLQYLPHKSATWHQCCLPCIICRLSAIINFVRSISVIYRDLINL